MMSHLIQIYAVCPLVYEFSIRYSLNLTFFENLQTKICCLFFGSERVKICVGVKDVPLSVMHFHALELSRSAIN